MFPSLPKNETTTLTEALASNELFQRLVTRVHLLEKKLHKYE